MYAFGCTCEEHTRPFLRSKKDNGGEFRFVRKNYYVKSFRAPRFFPDGRLKVPSESNLQIPSGASSPGIRVRCRPAKLTSLFQVVPAPSRSSRIRIKIRGNRPHLMTQFFYCD